MTERDSGRSADTPDPNEILDALLGGVEEVIQESTEAAAGIPLFAVEAVLAERLRAALPHVRFTAQDIRARAARISS